MENYPTSKWSGPCRCPLLESREIHCTKKLPFTPPLQRCRCLVVQWCKIFFLFWTFQLLIFTLQADFGHHIHTYHLGVMIMWITQECRNYYGNLQGQTFDQRNFNIIVRGSWWRNNTLLPCANVLLDCQDSSSKAVGERSCGVKRGMQGGATKNYDFFLFFLLMGEDSQQYSSFLWVIDFILVVGLV